MQIRASQSIQTRRKKTKINEKDTKPLQGKEEEILIYKLLTTTPLLPHFLRNS
jgi:hypothetical protein